SEFWKDLVCRDNVAHRSIMETERYRGSFREITTEPGIMPDLTHAIHANLLRDANRVTMQRVLARVTYCYRPTESLIVILRIPDTIACEANRDRLILDNRR